MQREVVMKTYRFPPSAPDGSHIYLQSMVHAIAMLVLVLLLLLVLVVYLNCQVTINCRLNIMSTNVASERIQ